MEVYAVIVNVGIFNQIGDRVGRIVGDRIGCPCIAITRCIERSLGANRTRSSRLIDKKSRAPFGNPAELSPSHCLAGLGDSLDALSGHDLVDVLFNDRVFYRFLDFLKCPVLDLANPFAGDAIALAQIL